MRKAILMAGVLMAASMVQAEVLAWRVDLGAYNSTFETAQLFATTEVANYWETGAAESGQINKLDNTYGVVTYESTLTVGNTFSFFVKLFGSDGTTVIGYSALKDWNTLMSEGSLAVAAPGLPATAWNAVPEPTAMALLAMGLSALLLRRKRVA